MTAIPGAAPARDALAVRLAAFAALAAFGAGHWAGLVDDAPTARMAAATAVAVAGGAVLALVGRARPPRAAAVILAAIGALATLAAGLAVVGLDARLLVPSNWDEFADGIDRGLSAVRTIDWPYAGPDSWVRLTLMLGAPLLLALAATLAFWPAERAAPVLRAGALVALVVLYATAVIEHDPGQPLLRGLALLLLAAAWLWLPGLPRGEAAAGAALVLVVGVASLPLAARLDGERPWWDYRSWDWFGGGKAVTFDWNHSYGPLDWPRDGTTLLNVKTDRPHYWKAETLDRFDGFRWVRSHDNARAHPATELPERVQPAGRSWEYFEYNRRWDTTARFTVRSLASDFVVGPGTTYEVRGAGAVAPTADGTTQTLAEPLEEGDTYTVRAYAPNPTAAQMRGAPLGYAHGLERYTAIFLPRPGETALGGGVVPGDAARSARPAPAPVLVPLRGEPLTGTRGAVRRLLASPYARAYRLTRRLTAGAPTAYDAAKTVERHLQRGYEYSERPPARAHPLAAFLFEDRKGYCQQFSGAMALMLRMAGIPSRVVAGFSPGSYNPYEREYRVRDLDAHSWVEVHFSGIGWVPFDPTPAAAPAARGGADGGDQAVAADAGASRGEGGERPERDGVGRRRDGTPTVERGSKGGVPWPLAGGLACLAVALLVGWGAARRRLPRRAATLEVVEAQVRELRQALLRLGWRVPAGTTLLDLERRLARGAGPAAASYAAKLRAQRYGGGHGGPGALDRRALRRELVAAGGIRTRLLALLALPPGGPRTS